MRRPVAPGTSAEALGVVLIGIGAATALQYRLGASRAVQREVRDELPAFVVERLLGPEPEHSSSRHGAGAVTDVRARLATGAGAASARKRLTVRRRD